MIELREILAKTGVPKMVAPVFYSEPDFINKGKVLDALNDIVDNNLSVLIEGDYDVDGLKCALIIRDMFKRVGHKNYKVFRYGNRTHGVDRAAVLEAIQGKYAYMIIADTGSSDMQSLRQLLNYGVKVIVLDHHKTNHSYSDFELTGLCCINTQLENYEIKENRYCLSAGALCYTIADSFIRRRGLQTPPHLVAYALISLYADCMDMSNALNRSIYWKSAENSLDELPTIVRLFMDNYTAFTRRFIEFRYAPRINSLFRSENFKQLNYLFFEEDQNAAILGNCLMQIEQFYTENRELVKQIADLVKVESLTNFVTCDLQSTESLFKSASFKLHNYTGLIANKLCERYGKPAVTYCETVNGFKGSLRDLRGRNYLTMFSNICNAGGHNSAFGFQGSKLGIPRFLEDVERLDRYFAIEGVDNQPIALCYEVATPDEGLINTLALFNDFSGVNLPIIFIKKKFIGHLPEKYSKHYRVYEWGEIPIQSSNRLRLGDDMLLKPIRSNNTKLIVQ